MIILQNRGCFFIIQTKTTHVRLLMDHTTKFEGKSIHCSLQRSSLGLELNQCNCAGLNREGHLWYFALGNRQYKLSTDEVVVAGYRRSLRRCQTYYLHLNCLCAQARSHTVTDQLVVVEVVLSNHKFGPLSQPVYMNVILGPLCAVPYMLRHSTPQGEGGRSLLTELLCSKRVRKPCQGCH